ncbi:hypothetical protein [Kribbella sp. DT2]|uniref:hypothetical protein n=1 Tax=Kribbella sp. DT2 TaxID=3393427 RepID=UPI003CF4C84B
MVTDALVAQGTDQQVADYGTGIRGADLTVSPGEILLREALLRRPAGESEPTATVQRCGR